VVLVGARLRVGDSVGSNGGRRLMILLLGGNKGLGQQQGGLIGGLGKQHLKVHTIHPSEEDL
jgi:hypothetical protein